MILKVKRLDASGGGWKYIDNIKRIITREITEDEFDEKTSIDKNRGDIDFAIIDDYNKNKSMQCICTINDNGKEKHIDVIFNTPAYLCNDEGQTIEKLIR